MINIHLSDDDKRIRISEHCIRRLIKWLDPIINKICKRPQSSSQQNDSKHARYNWTRHILSRLQLYNATPADFINNVLPQWLSTKVLRDHDLLLSIDQIVFFDEMY